MKKIALFLALTMSVGLFTDCVKSSKKCRQNGKKIKKMRKSNPNFKV